MISFLIFHTVQHIPCLIYITVFSYLFLSNVMYLVHDLLIVWNTVELKVLFDENFVLDELIDDVHFG